MGGATLSSALIAGAVAVAQPPQPVVPAPTVPAPSIPVPDYSTLPTVPLTPPVIPPVIQVPHIAPMLSEAQAARLRQMLQAAASHGITLRLPDPRNLPNGPQLVEAAMAYAKALHGGSLTSADYIYQWGLRPPAYDPWPGFLVAVAQDRVAQWIAALPPPYTGYENLRRGLAAYRAIEAKGGWSSVPAGPELRIGSSGPRVVALRKRLAVEDDGVSTQGATYDMALAEAVRRAQKRYGLEPTGTLGPQTLAALNVSAGERVNQIIANMERWRWLPPELPTNRIQVNIAAAVLTVFRQDSPILSMRAVTGRPGDETPMLHSRIHSVVLNPPWNVPTSIATKELWPKEKSSPGYLVRNGFRVISNPDGSKRLQQASGDQSALGRFKFDFDNPYGVYLHDTPSRSKFESYSRMVSHGCVRLAKPAELAKLLLAGDPTWTPEAIDAAITTGTKTTRAKLSQPISVFLLYWTAYATPNGQMSFRGDPYAWDELLAAKVEGRGAQAPVTVARN